MKQLNLLKTLFLLCALVVGSLNSWADEAGFVLESKPFAGKTATNVSGTIEGLVGETWTIALTGSDASKNPSQNMQKSYYWQIGANGNQTTAVISTAGITGTITNISVDCAAYQGKGEVSVTVGGVAFGGDAQTMPTWVSDSKVSGAESGGVLDFSGSASGAIEITMAPTSGGRAIYLHSVTITYSSGAVVDVTGVSLDQTSLSLTAGDKATLTPTVSPAEATNKNVTWGSNDESVATVAGGVVTAVAAGTCTITVTTVDGGFTATCDVTVNAAPVASATLDFTDAGWGFPSDYTKTEKEFSNGGYSITMGAVAADGYKALKSGDDIVALIFGKNGAKLTFSAFPFNVKKIKVYGRSGAASGVKFNIFVGEEAVSSEATGSHVDHDFIIADDKQDAGTIYVLKLTTTDKNCQISKIEIFGYVEKDVTSAGYATYVAPKNLEFAEGDAYAVTIDGGVAKLNAVTAVPAGTPVLLKGEGTKKPAVLEDAPAAPAANDLKEGNGTTPTNAYVLANQTKGVGFYKWNGGAIPAGKVYLDASGVAAHEFISIDLENGEVTGINEIAADKTFNGEFFNLAGQRVAQPTKGLYIVNGKKVIIK